jgi:hypothetical protein
MGQRSDCHVSVGSNSASRVYRTKCSRTTTLQMHIIMLCKGTPSVSVLLLAVATSVCLMQCFTNADTLLLH